MAFVALASGIAAATGCKSDGKPNLFGIPLPVMTEKTEGGLTEREARQLELFAATVNNPSSDIDADTRRQAAEELMAMDEPKATATLAEALLSGEPAVELAVIDAMERSPETIDGLLPAAVETLHDVSEERLEKLSLVLPRYGEKALEMVAARARDRSLPPAQRVGPIYALAAFRSREAAVHLMAMLQEPEPEPPEIVTATGVSLERLTGLPYGSDAEQWRRWWGRLKDEPIEDWLRIMVLHLSKRTSELEREVHRATGENALVAERLAETYRELFLTLSADEQLERLPGLLTDELAPVRAFALGRVERRLRDSERIPQPLQEKLAELLSDPREVPSSRLLAARLLNDLNYDGTAVLVTRALQQEQDPQIVTGYLEVLSRRPTPEALDLVLHWLNDSVAGEAAAEALWAYVTEGLLEPPAEPAVREAVRTALAWRTTPFLVRLLAAVGDGDDLDEVQALLDDQNPALRAAAAEGLAFAERLDPLLERVHDEVIYPHAIRLLAQGPAEVRTLRAVAELPPPEIHRQEWAAAIRTTARRLPADRLVEADDVLAELLHVDRALRVELLSRVTEAPPDELPLDERETALIRIADLQIELGQYQRAFEVLNGASGANGAAASAELARTRFKAALLAGHYDEAETLEGDVRVWITMLEQFIVERAQAAEALRDEIRRRFRDRIDANINELLRAAEERLMQATTASATGAGESSP